MPSLAKQNENRMKNKVAYLSKNGSTRETLLLGGA